MKRTLCVVLALMFAGFAAFAQDEEEAAEPQETQLRPMPYLSVMPSHYLGDIRDR